LRDVPGAIVNGFRPDWFAAPDAIDRTGLSG
jgi:hypothetical protein